MSHTTPAPTAAGDTPVQAAATPPVPAAPVTPPIAPAPAPAAVVPPAAAPAPATKPTAAEIAAKASPSQLRDLALGRKPAAAPVPVAAPPVAPTPEPVAAAVPVPPAEPVSQPAAPAPGDDAHKLPDRFRFTDENDQMVALLAKREGISLIEASRRVDALRNPAGTTPTPAAATPAQPATPPAPVVSPEAARVSAIDADIAAKRAEVKALREDMNHEKADDLMVEIATLAGEKQLIAAEARRNEQQSAQSFEGAVMASRERALSQFAVLGDPTSPHHVGLIGYVTMEQAKPERQAFFNRPDYPEAIAQEYAKKYGIPTGAAPTPPAPAVPPAPTPAVVTKPQAKQVSATGVDGRLLTTGEGNTPPAPAMTPAEAIAALRNMTPKQRAGLRQTVLRVPAS